MWCDELISTGERRHPLFMQDGVEKEVTAIEKDGHNYVKLQDLRDSHIDIGYDSGAGVPIVAVK